MTAVKYDQGADGIVTLTLDLPGRPMNVLHPDLTNPLSDAIIRIEGDKNVKGVILTSGKKEFLAGADIDGVVLITDPAVAFNLAEQFKALLRRLEKLGRPVVAALNGIALGGGLELALACNYRVAINNPKTQFGLPEVKLGLLPGGGGTQRLPRLIGIQASLPLMLEGKTLNPEKAKQQGIIHEVAADADDMFAKARAWIVANPNAMQPWDDKKFKWPGGDSKNPANVQMWAIAPSMASAKSYGNYPAVTNIMSCVFEGGIVDFDTGCEIESRYFANLVVSQVSKNMIGTLWFQLNAINKGSSRPMRKDAQVLRAQDAQEQPQGIEKSTVKKLGILGAGMMGAGIAHANAARGIACVLKDVSPAKANAGIDAIRRITAPLVAKGRLDAAREAKLLALVTPTADAGALDGCDLLIEAVFENRELKGTVTREAEPMLAPGGVFASNTSTLPITGLATASRTPERFVGLHFFSPVHKMRLVEIIRGKQTSDETIARAFDYVAALGKTPIVVNDSRGFFTSRVFGSFVMEGAAMLAEGIAAPLVEHAALAAGMPVGPLAVLDETSLSLSVHVMEQTRADLAAEGRSYSPSTGELLVERMVRELKRPGRAAGAGFYDYAPGQAKRLWPGLKRMFEKTSGEGVDIETLKRRFLYRQSIETARCLAEGVLTSTHEANIGSIFGIGFPAWTGGAIQFIASEGRARFLARAEALAATCGERFAMGPEVAERLSSCVA
jgi:3-hydroxyacyl-CoA dehydrogenase/enoyl-CoA hydratase/3-hydroxybutyryl-CoA epimerase